MAHILKITDQRAVLKRRPVYVGELPEADKFPINQLTQYEIQSYAYADSFGDFDEHIKFTLKDGNLKGFNTWFIFNRFAEVEFDGQVVYPMEEQTAAQILEITQDTILKRRPVASSELAEEEMYKATKGMTFELHSYAYADAKGEFNNHIRFAINNQEQYIRGLSTWYAYEQHAQVKFDDTVVYPVPNAPADSPAPAKTTTSSSTQYKGKAISVPGKGTVYTDQPIISGGSFTWGDATHGGVRVPQSAQHANNMVALATQLQKARNQIGKPFRVTSWYRPNPWNARAGGAKRSQHLEGKGVDIVVQGFMGADLARQFVSWWPGGLGIYPGNRRHILHLDVGPKRKWGF
ncbi:MULTISPECIES: D-Ala-D-Ala carboxypeptidase family metallohydrolase [unclassified Leptolyngbya]|uniref:YcbK family protein n=1 Tax=unclassified Leptolyngbya TaxID=2650499 RepID=UPI0016899698|nr:MULTISPECIES: D-Ala-D-Ala carboxypeptidase family metallohydrolase [unclassified Leptolyngbya]MBD1914164.1 DUF882 domain-containing protein [Leptolyngbya sp. FACHB-8]MBD2157171.1 DUF882 domain-containing protein [Leptolyngbya sp. FACHB-16]